MPTLSCSIRIFFEVVSIRVLLKQKKTGALAAKTKPCPRDSALIIPIKRPDGQPKICNNACKSLPFSHVHATIASGPETYQFACPLNPDDVLDSMTDEQYEEDKFLPYWAQQWPASLTLFNYVSLHFPSVIPVSGTICEMGSGLGMISMFLSAGKKRIVATDIAYDACRYSMYNMGQYSSHPMALCSDWRTSPFKTRFDCILASDILYEQRWISPVLNFLGSSLKNDGTAFIADPCRQWWQEFKDTAIGQGFTLNKAWEELVNQGKTTVEVLCLTRNRIGAFGKRRFLQ
jgi:ETFB lysine methyltransferase